MRRLLVLGVLLVLAVPASAARLPVLAPHDWWPVFSPDGSKVAFTQVNGQGRVFVLESVDVRTRHVVRLAQASFQLLPSWSPDSARVAYQAGGRIWTVGADGRGRRAVHAGGAPAWSPDGSTIAFVEAGVVHAGAQTFGSHVEGVPAWSPDGKRLAYAEPGGIFVATLGDGGSAKVAAPAQDARFVAWSPDGTRLAYASGANVDVVAADGSSAPAQVAGPFADLGPLAWAPAGDGLAFSARGALERTSLGGSPRTERVAATTAPGASLAPDGTLAFAGPNPRCAGHDAIRLYLHGVLAGDCTIAGTAAADTIDGTRQGGDVILAGAGNDTIRARNGHRDTVDCGAGRDTVVADRVDRLLHCEVVRF